MVEARWSEVSLFFSPFYYAAIFSSFSVLTVSYLLFFQELQKKESARGASGSRPPLVAPAVAPRASSPAANALKPTEPSTTQVEPEV